VINGEHDTLNLNGYFCTASIGRNEHGNIKS